MNMDPVDLNVFDLGWGKYLCNLWYFLIVIYCRCQKIKSNLVALDCLGIACVKIKINYYLVLDFLI